MSRIQLQQSNVQCTLSSSSSHWQIDPLASLDLEEFTGAAYASAVAVSVLWSWQGTINCWTQEHLSSCQ
jgi:hypothetical protein